MRKPEEHAHEWLAARLDGVPSALHTRIVDAVRHAGKRGGAPVSVFQAAASELLQETLDEGTESSALTLLAADALITYVCEYCSERQPELLMRLS